MFISSEGMWSSCGSQAHMENKMSFTPCTVHNKINKSPILLAYTCMSPLFDVTFSASTYCLFFPSSLSSDPTYSELPERDASLPPSPSVIFMWELNGTRSPEHPPSPPRPPRGDCAAWPGLAWPMETPTLADLGQEAALGIKAQFF